MLNSEGLDVWAGYHHVAPMVLINFQTSLVWLFQHNAGWHEIIEAGSDEERFALLRNEEWRERARKTWDSPEATDYARSPQTYELFDSETGAGPTGISLGEYMKRGAFGHPSDALAQWVLENGSASNLRMADVPKDRQAMDYLLNQPRTMGNQTDAGAHGKMLCGIGENILMLTQFVRDLGEMAIEQAVHILSGKIAGLFGLSDRGVLRPGLKADIVVFDLDEIECRPEYKMFDVPDGEGGRTYRYSRPPAPMRLTLVNGVATFDRNSFTGYFPGRFIGPGVKA
jgi:N-acyl-D-amino-acid deacylase